MVRQATEGRPGSLQIIQIDIIKYSFVLKLNVTNNISVSVVGSIPTAMPLSINIPGMGLLTETLHFPL